MARDYPLPDTPSLHPPETDDVLVDYMGNESHHLQRSNTSTFRQQSFQPECQMLNLWAHLEEQQLTVGQGSLI